MMITPCDLICNTVAENPGSSSDDIAWIVKIPHAATQPIMAKLEAEGKLTMNVRDGCERWFVKKT